MISRFFSLQSNLASRVEPIPSTSMATGSQSSSIFSIGASAHSGSSLNGIQPICWVEHVSIRGSSCHSSSKCLSVVFLICLRHLLGLKSSAFVEFNHIIECRVMDYPQ